MRKYRLIISLASVLIVMGTGYYIYAYLHPDNQKGSSAVNSAPLPAEPVAEKKPIATEPPAQATFLFGGDMMFDRMVYHTFKSQEYSQIFAKLDPSLWTGKDLVVANLEGPITDQAISDDTSPNNLVFNFPQQALQAIKSINLKAVSLANNHTLNAGSSGLDTTNRLLLNIGIEPIGQPQGVNSETIGHFKTNPAISVIGVNTLLSFDAAMMEGLIKQEKIAGNFVIMMPHWGAEYQTHHGSVQENYAKKWIEAGADMIIGGHPHVVQDCQIYNRKPIFYSLGNLVFDQTFSSETQQGILVSGTLKTGSLMLALHPYKITKYQPQLMTVAEGQTLIDRCFSQEFLIHAQKLDSQTITFSY